MRYRNVTRENTAVAGVIEALLLVALVAIILSTIQLVYIPQIMEEKEAEHMDQVSNQFSQLKSAVEFQSMMGAIGTGESIAYSPVSSPITLGSKELPYFVTARSYGEVALTDLDDAGDYLINIQPAPADFPSGIPLTSIKYEAFNSEFIDQTYVLEGGGIVLKQPEPDEGEVMKVNPSISVENASELGYIKINWNIPLFDGVTGKKSYGGYGYYKECFIRTNYTTHYTHSGSTAYVYIYTDYPDAWNKSFIQDDTGILWEFYNNGYINFEVDDSMSPNRVEITPGTKFINLELTIVKIGVQIGPGVIV